jgi:hypothetical protein
MAIYKNITAKGKILKTDKAVFFQGRNADGLDVTIRFTGEEKNAKGGRLPIEIEAFKTALHSSISDSTAVYIDKNTRLNAQQISDLRNAVDTKSEELFNGEDCLLNFSSAQGFYNKEKKVLVLESEIKSKETKNGVFHSLKVTEFKKDFGRDMLPIEVDLKYKDGRGFSRKMKVGDIGIVKPTDVMMFAEPIKSFTDKENIDYLFDLNANNIEFNRASISGRGETPTFQNQHFTGDKKNITPQLNIFVSKSVLRHLGGEYGAIKSVFELTNNEFKVPLEVNGREVSIDGTNLEEFKKDRDVQNACMSYILSKSGNSYAKLFGFLKVSDDALKEAKDVDKYNKIVTKMQNSTTINKYLEESGKLQALINENGLENSPVGIKTFVSLVDSIKKLNNDATYKKGFEQSLNGMLGNIKTEVENQIKTQIYIYKNSKSESGKKVYENLSKRVEGVFDKEGRITSLDYKKDEKNKGILDYINVSVKGQVPMMGSETYKAISLKGMINNNPTFTPFGNRGTAFEIDSKRVLTLLGVPTVATKQKRVINIDVANDTNANLVKDNRGRKKKIAETPTTDTPKPKTTTAKVTPTPAVETPAVVEVETPQVEAPIVEAPIVETEAPQVETPIAEVEVPSVEEQSQEQEDSTPTLFDEVDEVEISVADVSSISAEETELGIDIDELEDWLSEEAPNAGKAEKQQSVTVPSF